MMLKTPSDNESYVQGREYTNAGSQIAGTYKNQRIPTALSFS